MSALEKAYLEMQKGCGINVGDSVEVLREASSHELGWNNSWNHYMSDSIGKTLKVTNIDDFGIRLLNDKCNGLGYEFPFFVLRKVAKSKTVKVICEGKETEISRESAKALNLI